MVEIICAYSLQYMIQRNPFLRTKHFKFHLILYHNLGHEKLILGSQASCFKKKKKKNLREGGIQFFNFS